MNDGGRLEIVLKNPFRILGLPITSGSREIAKRVSDLEMFAELGKEKTYELDLCELGEIDRSLEAIKDAARRIELPENRVLQSLFWFRKGDAVDDLALECLSNFDLSEAFKIWTKQIEKSDELGKLTWRINRAVYSLWMSDDLDKATAHFEQALEDIGYITDELCNAVIDGTPGADQVRPERVRELVADILVNHAARSVDRVYGSNAIRLIEHCWSFHPDTLEYIKIRVTNPLINAVQDAVDRSKARRLEGTTVDDLRRKNGLSKVEHLIYELRDALGEKNPTFQAAANSFADEVIACAVSTINRHKAVPTAIVLAEWAAELPSFGQSRKWLMEQRGKILSWDSNYESDDETDEELADIEVDPSADEDEYQDEDEEIESSPDPQKMPQGVTACPSCAKRFLPSEIIQFLDFGVRCPHCRQAIVL
jgi:hypothetical protein